MTARPRRWLVLALAPLVAVTMLLVPASPASADPDDDKKKSSTADDGDDNPLLNDVLDSTGRRFLAARSAVSKSTKTQLGLALKVKNAESRRDALLPEVGAVAAQQYRTGGISTMGFLLNTEGPDGFLKKAVSLEEINALNDGKLRELYAAIDEVTTAKARLDQEVKAQQQNLALMKKQKESAENALSKVGGNTVTGGFVLAKSPVAAPAPRNSNGDFSPESCSVKDPTTSGCITARTFHMYKEVRKAGFKRFVGCHRNGGPFEHPKGRACDWSLQNSGFAPWHNQDTRKYGNNLMAFLVRNADRLGLLYVIWNKQIWFPATGWKSYSGPSDHTDHVHVSML
jgi:peptidoglycan DL-endopeptidase CwlO